MKDSDMKVTVRFYHNKREDKVAIAILSKKYTVNGYAYLTKQGKIVEEMNGLRNWFGTIQQAREALKIHARREIYVS
jgi:hypothetical protein